MSRMRSFPRVVIPIASGLVVLALLWWAFAVPALVKYPTDLDVTARYAGTFSLFVDPATAKPLPAPMSVPLDIERHIHALGHESSSSRVVVEESITQKAGHLFSSVQTNVYVMDRHTMKNVADNRAYAFEPSNVVDRSGTYRLNLPFDTDPGSTYQIYKNETHATYALRGDSTTPVTRQNGLDLRTFTAAANELPLDGAYLEQLNKLVPLPEAMTFDQLKLQVKAAGLDVDAVLRALAPVITEADAATLAQLATKSIPLQYVSSFRGTTAVEPTTGAEVDVGATESVGARPVLADVGTFVGVLSHYPNVPQAAAATKAMTSLGAAPATKLFEFQYQQTPASVADIADKVTSMRTQIHLVKEYVPLGLLSAAALTIAIGAAVGWRRGRGPTIDLRTATSVDHRAPEEAPVWTGRSR